MIFYDGTGSHGGARPAPSYGSHLCFSGNDLLAFRGPSTNLRPGERYDVYRSIAPGEYAKVAENRVGAYQQQVCASGTVVYSVENLPHSAGLEATIFEAALVTITFAFCAVFAVIRSIFPRRIFTRNR